MQKTRVLFLCTGNTSRSQLAEAILRHKAGDRFEAHSAGLRPTELRTEVLAVLAEAGISADGLSCKGVDEYLGKIHINYLVTVCSDAEKNCPRIWPPGGARIFWPLDDPAVVEGDEELRLAAYRKARDELSALIDAFVEEPERNASRPL